MPRSWYSVQAQAPNAAEIDIRGIIGDWGLTDQDLIAEVEMLGEVAEITLRINSRGGSAAMALSLFNYLRNHPARITVRVEGVAMSAATIVMMAANHIVMCSNTLLMIHNVFFEDPDDPMITQEAIDALKLWRAALVETYAARVKVSRDELGVLLDAETFMDPARALELGFCDEIEQVGAKRDAPAALAVLACAAGIPDDIAARLVERAAAPDDDDQERSGGSGTAAVPPELTAPHATLASQIVAAAAELELEEHAPVFAVAADITTIESARSALVQACEVRDLCKAAGLADLAGSLIRARAPLAKAREFLAGKLASESEQIDLDHHAPLNQATLPSDRRASVTTASIYAARKTHRY